MHAQLGRTLAAAGIAVVLGLGLAACSSTPQITSGTIIAKQDLPASSGIEPVDTTVIGPNGSVSVAIVMEPYTNPEEWQIELSNKKQKGWLDVGPSFYYSKACVIGKHFGGPTGTPDKTRVTNGIQQPDAGSS